jgi:2,4-dichlorophenol 6-monooxygenase
VLGLTEAENGEEMRQQIEERKANTPRRRPKREALVATMELKDYEFNVHGVDLGQFYELAAVVPDGSERHQPTRDPELY